MKRLFIIGNGFDISHFDIYGKRMKTQYIDFRDYICQCFIDCQSKDVLPTERTIMGGDIGYNEDEVAGYIVNILDGCSGENWADLESSLGDSLYDWLFSDLIDVEETMKNNDDEKWWYRDANNNEERAGDMNYVFHRLRELFEDWVNEHLVKIKYEQFKRNDNIQNIFSEKECEFITFNYTLTLERLYNIPGRLIHHFHGKVGEKGKDIIFGHGNDIPIESIRIKGAEDELNELKRFLRKNTDKVIMNNLDVYESLFDVKEIFSYGFSFSEVDMVYIEKLSKYINPVNVTWYFNSYDSLKHSKYLKKVEQLGYNVQIDKRW